MGRPSITVVLKPSSPGALERRLDANGLLIGNDGSLTFLCSGTPETVAAVDVERIEWSADGATWCSMCDQPWLPMPARPSDRKEA